MSVVSFIEGLFSGTSLSEIETDISTAEKVTLNGLTAFSSLIASGATAAEGVVTDLNALLPKVQTAISNAATKAEGWAADLKSALADAETWIAARTVSAASGAELGKPGTLTAAAFHIT